MDKYTLDILRLLKLSYRDVMGEHPFQIGSETRSYYLKISTITYIDLWMTLLMQLTTVDWVRKPIRKKCVRYVPPLR